MVGWHDLVRKKAEPDDVIPPDSPWYWRWGLQGLKAVWRYKQVTSGRFDNLQDNEPSNLAHATEPYQSAQFACKYGREGHRRFREYVKYVEDEKIVSRRELQDIICSRELNIRRRDGSIRIRPSLFNIVMGIAFLVINLSVLVAFSATLLPLRLPTWVATISVLVITGLCFYHLWEFNGIALRPFRVARRKSSELNHVLKKFVIRPAPQSVPLRGKQGR